MSEIINIPLQIFLSSSLVFLSISLLCFVVTLVIKLQLQKHGKTRNNNISTPLFEVNFLHTVYWNNLKPILVFPSLERLGLKIFFKVEDNKTKKNSGKTVRLVFALDVIAAFFFCGFLLFFSIFSYLHWVIASLLILFFLVCNNEHVELEFVSYLLLMSFQLAYWGFLMTSFWKDLFTYWNERCQRRRPRSSVLTKEMFRQMVLKQVL
jgi:hypothetical protein